MRHVINAALFAIGFLVIAPATTNAGLFSSKLSFDGTLDNLNDDSQAVIYDNDGDDLFSIGDDIVGLIRIDSVDGVPVEANEQIFAAFALRISGEFTFGGILPGWMHGAVAPAAANSLPSLIDDALKPAGFGADAAWGSSIFAILTSTTAASPFATDVNPATSIAGMTAANGWSLEAIGGLVGDDFFETLLSPLAALIDLGGNADGDVQISEIRADSSGTMVLSERMAATIQYHDMGSGTVFLPLTIGKYSGGSAVGDIVLRPDGSVQTTDLINSDVVNDSNFQINAVPEPGSMTLLAMGLVGAGGVHWRRRRALRS